MSDATVSAARIEHVAADAEYPTAEGCLILESWNRADDPAVSIARARVAPGVTTRRHLLVETQERYLILVGRGLVEVGDLAPAWVTAGAAVYIPAGCAQRIYNPGPGDLVFLAICSPRFRPDAYRDIDTSIPAPLRILS